jgi:nitrous oxidase accessory protein NosD
MTHRRSLLLVGLAVLMLTSVAVGPAAGSRSAMTAPGAPAGGSTLVPCGGTSGGRVAITRDAHLDPRCTYAAGFDITASGITLDCRGAVIDGTGQGGVGIEVSTPANVDLSAVTIRNCTVRGFLNSIRVTRGGFRSLEEGHEYDHHLSGVRIESSRLSGSHGVGIFVDGYVTRTTIRHSSIREAGSAGIYLEAGSADNVVEHNAILHNGYRENGPGGQLFSFGGHQFRFWGIGREGLSIDGSRRNRVTANRFEGNSAGSIFLYTSCGEFVHQRPERWFSRRFGADDNRIESNSFSGGINGVWVGSRMGENTSPMDCSDPAYIDEPVNRVSLDRAAGNSIRSNTFRNVTYGVRVEDDRTEVIGNRFAGADDTQWAVIVGTRLRTEVLLRPVSHATIVGNRSSIAGNRNPYRWVHGIADARVGNNRALGRRVGICEGRELPHSTFIFVLALALEEPGSPVTATPDLTVPTLGALPACGPSLDPR